MLVTRKIMTVGLAVVLAGSLTLPEPAEASSKRTKNTIGGAVAGAGVGYLVGGSDGAAAGAVVGAIAGYRKKR